METLQANVAAGNGRPRAEAGPARPLEVAHAAARGAIAAMAMTGMRTLTVNLGIVEEPPPAAIMKQRVPGLIRRVPRRRQPALIELAHWSYGAAGGAAFALLPAHMRRRAWAGPLYGFAVWIGFEAGIAPALGLKQAKKLRGTERAALAADHLLYGLVLSEMRRRPRE